MNDKIAASNSIPKRAAVLWPGKTIPGGIVCAIGSYGGYLLTCMIARAFD
jgi:hypothetical protein